MEPSINATAASLLGFLHDGPASGWDLLNRARHSIGQFWSITPSQVYRELAGMARSGLIEAQAPGLRERQPYALTQAGRSAFRAWVDSMPGAETIRYPLLLTVAFGQHLPPERLADFARSHRAVHAERLAGYREARTHLAAEHPENPYALATVDFGIRYEEAVLDWFDNLPPQLGG